MQNIYVFGHRNPDSDSVCSSIGLAYLKEKLGYKVEPRILSDINKETAFVLDYFNVEKPKFLNDVKVRIKDIKFEKKMFINENASIYDAYNKMSLKNTTAIPLVNDENKLTGYVTLKEIARYLVSANKQNIETTYENLLSTLDGEKVLKFDEEIAGKVSVVGLKSITFYDEIKLTNNDILVTSNRPAILEYAINSGVKLLILTYGSKLDDEFLTKAKNNNINVITTSLDSFNIANRISLANLVRNINTNNSPVVVHYEDFYSDFKEQMHKINHTNYPVVNKKGECVGLIRLTGPNSYKKQEVILVDHNSFAQSVVGIEEADIVEIIDHHNLGAIGTTMPINFRSMPVGCTATIVYKMFIENKIEVPKYIAGLLLSAILSDTLLFTSPTCTDKDKLAAEKLAKIAKVDLMKYGHEMMRAGSSIEGMDIQDLVYNDFKTYNLSGKQIGLSQITTMDFEGIEGKLDEIVEYLNTKNENGFDLAVMFVTDIIRNGSYLIYNDTAKDIVKEAFNLKQISQGVFVKDLVSRKKQMLPNILETMELS